jgi:hypothetical protein
MTARTHVIDSGRFPLPPDARSTVPARNHLSVATPDRSPALIPDVSRVRAARSRCQNSPLLPNSNRTTGLLAAASTSMRRRCDLLLTSKADRLLGWHRTACGHRHVGDDRQQPRDRRLSAPRLGCGHQECIIPYSLVMTRMVVRCFSFFIPTFHQNIKHAVEFQSYPPSSISRVSDIATASWWRSGSE